MSISLSRMRHLGTAMLVGAVVAAVAPAGIPATAAATGYVRLAHLSPDTPAVDVYLREQSGAMREKSFPGVGYGAFSPYLRLPIGTYAVAMRSAGVPRTEPPVLTTQLTVAAGAAYTVAGVGRYADLGLRILRDDLSLPPRGEAKVRVVQASVRAPLLDVAVDGGDEIGSGVAFATTTDYRRVPPGTWRLRVRPSTGGAATMLSARLDGGNVYSLLVLDAPGGGLRTRLITDAARHGAVPSGGVATGAGGSSPEPRQSVQDPGQAAQDRLGAPPRPVIAPTANQVPRGEALADWQVSARPASDWPVALLLAGLAAVLTGTLTAAMLRRRPHHS